MRIKAKLNKRIAKFNHDLGVVFGDGVMCCDAVEGEVHLTMSFQQYKTLKQQLPESFSDFFKYFDKLNDQRRLSMRATEDNLKQLHYELTRAAYHLRKPQGILAYQQAVEEINKLRQAMGENQPLTDPFTDCVKTMDDVMAAVSAYQSRVPYQPVNSTRAMQGATLQSHIRQSLLELKAYTDTLPKVRHMKKLALALSVFGAVMILGAGALMLTGVLAAPGVGLMAAGVGMVASGMTLFQKRARVTKLSRAVTDFHARYQGLGFCSG